MSIRPDQTQQSYFEDPWWILAGVSKVQTLFVVYMLMPGTLINLVLVRWTYDRCRALQFLQQQALQFHRKRGRRSFSKPHLRRFPENQMPKPLGQHNDGTNGPRKPTILRQQLFQNPETERRPFPI